jgi:hypothetical protein
MPFKKQVLKNEKLSLPLKKCQFKSQNFGVKVNSEAAGPGPPHLIQGWPYLLSQFLGCYFTISGC